MLPSRLPRAQRRLVVGLIMLAGVCCSLLLWLYAERQQSDRIQAEFQRRAQLHTTLVRESLRAYEDTLLGLRTLFVSSSEVSREEFAQASRDLLQRRAGVKALQWVQIVPAAARADVERQAAAELHRPFVIRRRQADDTLQPAEPRDEYFAILYIEPLAGNEPALGYDVSSAPSIASLTAARQDGQLKVSRAFRLAQSSGPDDEPGVVFILPVRPAPPQPVTGFIQAVFGVRTMLAQVHRYGKNAALDSYYADLDADPAHPELLYANLGGREPQTTPGFVPVLPAAAPGDFTETLVAGDRHWRLLIQINPDWLRQQQSLQPVVILGCGLVITALLAFLLSSLLKRTAQVEEEVELRTAELRESEARLQAIIDLSPAIIFVKDLEGRYVLVNRAFRSFLQIPADRPAGFTDSDLFPGETARFYREKDLQVLSSGTPVTFEETVPRPGGEPLVCLTQKFVLRHADDKPYALCGIATDITTRKASEQERLQLERRLLEGQKLESLGVMAGGVAHDFNNILTSVLVNASLARRLAAAGPADEHLLQIENAARRAADLCQQLLAYAGKGKVVTECVNLTKLVRDTTSLLEVTINKNTRLDLHLAAGLPPVLADITQLRQIVMNLVINAADAIGGKPGLISIRTFACEAGTGLLRQAMGHPELPAGPYVGLEVTDNGSGMSPEIIRRIFEPFFTTKFSGRGLGLAAVQGIVQSHHGALFVESQPDVGSVFRLLLPATTGAATPSTPPFPRSAAPVQLHGQVLVVDDEDSVRSIIGLVLKSAGATVLTAASGEEALNLLRTPGDRVALILLDMTMPGISGEETLRRVRLLGIQAPVLLMSGYSEVETMKRSTDLGVAGFMPKPFEIGTLLERVKPFLG
ncbi:MAG: CHASE domain-containing protein [Lacunisphaera sp.]|nr:CHASE domain-containing protein [Lacunisphaera sp.]